MKTHSSRAFLLLPLVFLSACGATKSPSISAYFDESIEFKENFRLLQLTDIHWSVNTDAAKQGAYLTKVVETIQPDFIMLAASPSATSAEIGPFTKETISSMTSSSLRPSFAINDGLVVTPATTP